jgi:hypothetical protein
MSSRSFLRRVVGTSEPYEFEALAKYNGEVARGIVHTRDYDVRMAQEQARFNAKMAAERERPGRSL